MNRIDQMLADLEAQQKKGLPMKCPRCGRDTMKIPVEHNALSRIADVYVCSDCGMDEAKLAFMMQPGSLYDWQAFQPKRPDSDFAKRTGQEVWQQIQERLAGKILWLHRCWEDGELSGREVRFRALESLPGLRQIWTEPFMLRFVCAEGEVQIDVKNTAEGTELVAAMIDR